MSQLPREVWLMIAHFIGEDAVILARALDTVDSGDEQLPEEIADIAIDYHLARVDFEMENFGEFQDEV